MTSAQAEIYRDKLNRLVRGERLIVSDDFLDAVAHTDYGSEIRTAHNRQRCGIHDAYVAWILDYAKPADLEFVGMKAFATV